MKGSLAVDVPRCRRLLAGAALAGSLLLRGTATLAQGAQADSGLPAPTASASQAQTASAGPNRASLGALQDAFVSIADELEPAVVTVISHKTVRPHPRALGDDGDDNGFSDLGSRTHPRAYRSQGTGAGVIISADGWVLTNDHVIGGADAVTVRLHDGREFDGAVRRDYRSDLALVKIEGGPFPVARLGNSDGVKIGQWAVAIGSPYKYEGSFSLGVISGLDRHQEIRDQNGEGDGRLYPDMIQTDAAINPGNSGGPLIDLQGEVIGINTAIESENGASVGIGFAIPINEARFVADQLRAHGSVTYGYLGVEPETVTPRIATLYKVDGGALVRAEPPAASPAGKAGIHVEDVLTRIGSARIRTEGDVRTAVGHMAPGTQVEIALMRGGAERVVRATIAEAPAPRISHVDPSAVTVGLGVEVAVLTSDIANRVGLAAHSSGRPGPQAGQGGVVVKSVDSGSSVSETEMQTGDVILRINDVPTPTVGAFRKATAGLHVGDTVRILWQGKRYPETIKRVTIVTLD